VPKRQARLSSKTRLKRFLRREALCFGSMDSFACFRRTVQMSRDYGWRASCSNGEPATMKAEALEGDDRRAGAETVADNPNAD